MNEVLVFDDPFRHILTRNLFAPLTDRFPAAAGGGRENSVAGEERQGGMVSVQWCPPTTANSVFLWEWARGERKFSELTPAWAPEGMFISPLTGTTTPPLYQGSIWIKGLGVTQLPPIARGGLVYFLVPFSGTAVTVFLWGRRLPTEMPQGNQTRKAEDDASLRAAFASAFQTHPEGAVDRLVEQVRTRPDGGVAAAKVLLPYLVGASYAQQNLFLDAVLEASTPDDVMCAALILSRDSAGEGILEAAAAMLESFGDRSWPALAALTASKDPRCRHFVRAVGSAATADPQAKIDALVALAHNPDLDTRWLAASVAEAVSPEAAKAVWLALCTDSDAQLRTTAEARTASLSE